ELLLDGDLNGRLLRDHGLRCRGRLHRDWLGRGRRVDRWLGLRWRRGFDAWRWRRRLPSHEFLERQLGLLADGHEAEWRRRVTEECVERGIFLLRAERGGLADDALEARDAVTDFRQALGERA